MRYIPLVNKTQPTDSSLVPSASKSAGHEKLPALRQKAEAPQGGRAPNG